MAPSGAGWRAPYTRMSVGQFAGSHHSSCSCGHITSGASAEMEAHRFMAGFFIVTPTRARSDTPSPLHVPSASKHQSRREGVEDKVCWGAARRTTFYRCCVCQKNTQESTNVPRQHGAASQGPGTPAADRVAAHPESRSNSRPARRHRGEDFAVESVWTREFCSEPHQDSINAPVHACAQ